MLPRSTQLASLPAAILAAFITCPTTAQSTWQVVGATGSAETEARATDPQNPPLATFVTDGPNAMNPLTYTVSSLSVRKYPNINNMGSRGIGYGRFRMAGVGTPTVRINWAAKTTADWRGEPCDSYLNHGLSDLSATVLLDVQNPPAGPFTVYYQWNAIGNNNYRPEWPLFIDPNCPPPVPLPDDPSYVQNTRLDLNGASVFVPPNIFDMINLLAVRSPPETNGSIMLNPGDTLLVDFNVESRCEITQQGRRITIFGGAQRWVDHANTNFRGVLYLSFAPIPPGGPVQPACCPGQGDCFSAHPMPGCVDPLCCEAVSAIDPYCCEVEWDQSCVTLAEANCATPLTNCQSPDDCFTPHLGGGCNMGDCCLAVCAIDAFCCDVEWDQACVDAATQVCILLPGPANDDCANPMPVTDGAVTFITTGATLDGPAVSCASMGSDVWFEYNAQCTGQRTFSTCAGGGTGFNTVIAVYDSCSCPADPALESACNDDDPACPGGGSTVTIPVVAGQCYKIRVGGVGGAQGLATMLISDPSPPCPADVSPSPCGDDKVNVDDLLTVINSWGGGALGDINGDGIVNVDDLLKVIGTWGPCP